MPEIKGYRQLNAQEVALINRIKQAGNELQLLIDEVESMHILQLHPEQEIAERARLNSSQAERWRAMARTDLQNGIMKLVRAVAQPEGF